MDIAPLPPPPPPETNTDNTIRGPVSLIESRLYAKWKSRQRNLAFCHNIPTIQPSVQSKNILMQVWVSAHGYKSALAKLHLQRPTKGVDQLRHAG